MEKNLIAVITEMNPQVEKGKIGIIVNTPEPYGKFGALIDKEYIKKHSLGIACILEAKLDADKGYFALNIPEGETIYEYQE
ncbi:hypothetical protein JW949_04330 [Candidatus Woesearchaeota archaeon]|nr:hypothetical protein [Candidatus Woesearchaeota archaeon]